MPRLFDHEYFTSEKFIHDGLIKEAERGLSTILTTWKKDGKVTPFMISWPADSVEAQDGTLVTGPICYDLPLGAQERQALIEEIVSTTKPYGLLLCEQKPEEVRVLFETMHGAKSWHYPIKKSGVDRVLGKVSTTTDVHHIGILWKLKRAFA